MSDVRTVKLKFTDLVFLEDNPRTITREKVERLAGRIKKDPTFFDNRPCLVNYTDGKYICYGGFQRSHAAAKILKWKEVPCSVENDVPTELMRERAILDNTHDGEWDADVLANWEFDIPELREFGVPENVFGGVTDETEIEPGEDSAGGISKGEARKSLAERFIIPPFSVFDTRQGYWQQRKRQWLALGIKSELGRGGQPEHPHGRSRERSLLTDKYGGGQHIRRDTAERTTDNETAWQVRKRGGAKGKNGNAQRPKTKKK